LLKNTTVQSSFGYMSVDCNTFIFTLAAMYRTPEPAYRQYMTFLQLSF